VEGVKDFSPTHTFECGQCFRWIKEGDGSYTGVVKGKAANIRFHDGVLVLSNTSLQDFKDLWYDYFDLGRDYSEVKSRISKDGIMRKAVEFGHGIRLLKQEPWEMLISYIISSNNNIPRIKNTIKTLCRLYGAEIRFAGGSHYTFPTVESLASSSIEGLNICGGGYRCKYIAKTSRMVRDHEVCLEKLAGLSTGEARSELMRLPGVGAKVADCVLLYSGTKHDVFPTDVWVKRVMERLYFHRTARFEEIQSFAREYFDGLAGFAQQYLFYYARENKMGVK
jgi:N-glycosylase/DNA lyase